MRKPSSTIDKHEFTAGGDIVPECPNCTLVPRRVEDTEENKTKYYRRRCCIGPSDWKVSEEGADQAWISCVKESKV